MGEGRARSWQRVVLAVLASFALTSVGGPVAWSAPRKPTPTPSPSPSADRGTLVLYDTTNAFGWLGEVYATQVANLVSHFGGYTAKPVVQYADGDLDGYRAVVYAGSTYDEPLPAAFLDDVLTTNVPVLWMHNNIWQLGARPGFAERYGWQPGYFDLSSVREVEYKGVRLTRHEANAGGILSSTVLDPAKASAVATAVRADGTTFPWALRAANLTYVGEMPFTYVTETDRVLALEDLLFDALAPATPERHRALVRFEDVGPDANPAAIRAAADYLYSRGVPFSIASYTRYVDPHGFYNDGVAENVALSETTAVVDAIKYALTKGGTLLMHGYTHQYGTASNPYNGVSGDDFEFFRAHVDAEDYVRYDGPVAEDSTSWALGRVDAARDQYCRAGLPQPGIFEFPHYAGSAVDYRAIASRFSTRYERGLYYPGVLSGGTVDQTRFVGQFFPYVVKDVYGTTVLPENLGDISPQEYNHHPARFPEHLVDAARRNLVVRDGFASFFWHPFLSIDYLKQTVEGIQALGYTFVSAPSLAAPPTPVSVKCPGGAKGGKTVQGGRGKDPVSPSP